MLFYWSVFIVTIVMPTIFWFWLFRYLDRDDPEPPKVLRKLFYSGIVAAILSSLVYSYLYPSLFPNDYANFISGNVNLLSTNLLLLALMVALAGPIEETMKFILLKNYSFHLPSFNQISDGIVYGISVGLGFAVIENITYFISFTQLNSFDLVNLSIYRGVSSMMLHVGAAGLIGYGLGKMKFTPGQPKKIMVKYLIIAMAIHALFNAVLVIPGGSLVSMMLAISSCLYLIYVIQKPESRLIWKQKDPS